MAARTRVEHNRNTRRHVAMTIFVIMTSCLAKAAAGDAGESTREDDVDGSARFKRGQSIGSVECQYRCSSSNAGSGGEQSAPSSASCPLWCRQMSLITAAIAPSSFSSSSSSAYSSSSSSSSKSNVDGGLLRRASSPRHSKRQVDAEDAGTSTEDESSNSAASQSPPRVSVVVRATKRNGLEAIVEWQWQPYPGDGAGAMATYEFVLHWARDTCNLDERLPHCDDPDTYFSKTIRSKNASQNNFTIANLTYNSKYWVEVECDELTSPRVQFTTPGCSTPADKTFKRCLATSAVAQTTIGPADDVSLVINVTCLHFDPGSQSGSARLRWKLHDDRNSSIWDSTVLIRHPTPEGIVMEVQKTTTDETRVSLKPDTLYEITIKASKDHKDIIYRTLYLNVSRGLNQNNPDFKLSTKDDDCFTTTNPTSDKLHLTSRTEGHFHALILAIAVLALVAVTTVAVLCINRCRGVQSKLLKKTILSKSNSYKTTPGTPRLPKEEQLQMILKTDDWELDARDVTLGAEVGQGAFGLVMTGYYQNNQVAIKVLKGDVLPSYREELLREIALMKRIGKHPNIVSLIGACTIRDPIALIMEYMPFGNLQAFLQKCRVEGGLRRRDTGAEVEYCPLDELNGTKEFWVLTSTDMLSFARQVAVSMEFLTDRKYVHRDLAARNVLVGQNKVVKLCDFGLARLVYNGDQYYKLTNGRLPLKWMALESIRDRVFTAQSDVWSYGVLLWEIATLGCSPYSNIALVDLYRLLTEGYRMEQPKNCSAELYDIMSQCWHENPSNRPTFSGIRIQLDKMLSQRRNYLDLGCLEPLQNGGLGPSSAPRCPSPTDVPYTSSASDLFIADDEANDSHRASRPEPMNAAATLQKEDDEADDDDDEVASTASDDPWGSASREQRWNSEQDDLGYLRSSDISCAVMKTTREGIAEESGDKRKRGRDAEEEGDEDVCIHLL